MHTGQFIKQTVSKNNSVDRKNKRSTGNYKFSTINQLPVPLKPSISIQDFQNHYFLRIGAVIQGLFHLLLSCLEQACLVNGVD